MKKLIKIEEDCFFICQRLKEVDPSYEVYYNLKDNSYEVHSKEQEKNSYCFKVPYNQLDGRTIDFAFKTRSQNISQLIAEIDRHNQLLYDKAIKDTVEKLKEALC